MDDKTKDFWKVIIVLFLICVPCAYITETYGARSNLILFIFGIPMFIGSAYILLVLYKYKPQNIITVSQQKEIPSDDSRYIPSEVKRIVWKRDGGKCVHCGSRHNLEYDHNIPVSLGGSNTENNIRILCKNCNRKKSGKIE